MSDDRYAPPTAPLTEPVSRRGSGRIELGEAFREAWDGTWSHFGLLFLAGVTGFVVAALSAATVVGLVLIVPVLLILYLLIGVAGQSLGIFARLTGSALLAFLGALLNLFWSFGVMPRLAFASYYVVEGGLAPADALRTSWEKTRDQKLICAVLALLSVLIPVVGVLCLLVGVIPAWMIAALMHAAAYRQ